MILKNWKNLEKEVALLRADVAESNKKLTENNNQLASLISLMSHNKASHNTTGQLSQIQSVPTSPPIMIHTQTPGTSFCSPRPSSGTTWSSTGGLFKNGSQAIIRMYGKLRDANNGLSKQ